MVSCYKIFEYWRNKCITSDGKVGIIGETSGVDVIRDDYRAECWGCGQPARPPLVFSNEVYDMSLSEVWADKCINSRLQKCHIFARQFGGSDTPDNLFLLCEDCHAESPDTKNRATFFRWIYRRKHECAYGIRHKLFFDEFVKEIESRGYNSNEFAKKYALACSGRDSSVVQSALDEVGFHCTGVTESTLVGCIVDEIERRMMEYDRRQPSIKRVEDDSNG